MEYFITDSRQKKRSEIVDFLYKVAYENIFQVSDNMKRL